MVWSGIARNGHVKLPVCLSPGAGGAGLDVSLPQTVIHFNGEMIPDTCSPSSPFLAKPLHALLKGLQVTGPIVLVRVVGE